MGKVIDLNSRLNKKEKSENSNSYIPSSEVTDITEVRAEKISADRREVRRTILTEFISVHAIVPGYGLLKVFLRDINDKGLAFDLEDQKGHYNVGDDVELRIYLNHQTFFKIDTKIAYVRQVADEGIYRHGCSFIKDSLNNDALQHFIKFLESVTASLQSDMGDILVSKINS